MKAFITKYALTSGILEVEGENKPDTPKMFVSRPVGSFAQFYHKPFWHETLEEAQAHAETLRLAKIGSLEKQMKKLRSLSFGG